MPSIIGGLITDPPNDGGDVLETAQDIFGETFSANDDFVEDSIDVTITTADGELQPAHISNYSADSYGQHTRLNDHCNNSETRQGGATGYQITIEGIWTLDQLRKTREIGLQEGVEATIDIQPWSDQYVIDTVSWDKPSDLNKWYDPNEYPSGIEAFTFQVQTKDPTSSA